MYRTTANRLRRIAVAFALTLGATGGALAATLTILGTGANGPASTAAVAHGTSNSSKAARGVVATTAPVTASRTSVTSTITSPSGAVSTQADGEMALRLGSGNSPGTPTARIWNGFPLDSAPGQFRRSN